jgi:hypothetical protein
MSPTILKCTLVSMGNTRHFFPTVTNSGIPRQILVGCPQHQISRTIAPWEPRADINGLRYGTGGGHDEATGTLLV